LHFALCKATYYKGMWCHVLQSNNTQHIFSLETNFMRDDDYSSSSPFVPYAWSSVKLPILL
jgi:hypothetical protein